jgi:hypothetical protein
MNTEKVENLYRKSWLNHGPSSFRCYARLDTRGGNRTKADLAIAWGTSCAIRLWKSGCENWAMWFLAWAWDCYHPYWWKLPEDHDENKRTEVIILIAASWMSEDTFQNYAKATVALTDSELTLVVDSINRGTDPRDALWPRPRRNKNLIRLMAAAQTIAHHETSKI